MARHIVKAGKHLIHEIEIDLPQSKRVNAAQSRNARRREAGSLGCRRCGRQFCK